MSATIHEHCAKASSGMGLDVVNIKPGSYQFVMNGSIGGFSTKQSAERGGEATRLRCKPCVSRTQCKSIRITYGLNRNYLNR